MMLVNNKENYFSGTGPGPGVGGGGAAMTQEKHINRVMLISREIRPIPNK